MHKDIEQKINARIAKSDGCWIWTGHIHRKDGYGRYRLPGMKWDKTAHRVVYELYTGVEIPSDMTIDHLCLNKQCVRPDHLEVVTRAENSRRARINDSEHTKTKRKISGFASVNTRETRPIATELIKSCSQGLPQLIQSSLK